MIRGGHRLWTAPESSASYELDNGPIQYKILGERAVEFTQPAGPNGFQKQIRLEILGDDLVRATHLLTNVIDKPLDYSIWCLTVLAPGGICLVPQPPLDLHPSEFGPGRILQPHEYWPNREVVLWPFTNITDGRYSYSSDFLRVIYKPALTATKIGLKLPTGWVAYDNRGFVFAKHFHRDNSLTYPDMGVNCEIFTNNEIFEVESLAPARPILPGTTHTHVEHWLIRKAANSLSLESDALAFFAQLPTIA
jgi:hypothetical protein